jgi:hypothetical protein
MLLRNSGLDPRQVPVGFLGHSVTGTGCATGALVLPCRPYFIGAEYSYSPIHYRRYIIQWGMLQRTMLQRSNATTNSSINKIRMLQRTRRNTIGRRSTRVRMPCRAFPLWLERQSSSLLPFVSYSYQFSSVICLFTPWAVIFFSVLLHNFSHEPTK